VTRLQRRAALLAAAFAAACAPPAAPAPSPAPVESRAALRAAIDSLFADTLFRHAHWGAHVRSLERGDTLFRLHGGKLFLPASNMKLVTGAAALETLGPEYRFRTRVAAAGPVRDGTLRGDLLVVGSGDPTISARFHAGDPRTVFRAWADSLRTHGVRRIEGRIVGDDDVFDDVPLGRGWAWDDLDAYYAAEISGLAFNEGVLDVRISPGSRPGDSARIALDPPGSYVPIRGRVATAAAGSECEPQVTRAATGPAFLLSGCVAADTAFIETVAIRDNTLFFLTVLREVLRESGIEVAGAALDADSLPPIGRPAAAPLFTWTSPPLAEILPAYLKPSQNQIAEILLRTVGREQRGEGSARAGAAVVDSLLTAWRIEPRRLVMADGSGLSRYDLLSPDLLVALLAHMDSTRHATLWREALPVAGVDGTLENRMRGTAAEGNVRAKTGTLTGVRALSGYVTTASGERIVFAFLVNHHTLSARDADRITDAALARIAEWRR
jgi:D-alanyl-D-alanine carboxypeptidase/D-alanyl-D-alanine-endopeptidase (penicillin-binding protein 4)